MSTETADPQNSPSPEEGCVGKKYATIFEPPQALVLESGETLGPVTVAYQTYGELSANTDNAVFICHALTGDAHVAGRHHPDERKPGWWDGFVGPGKAIDTDRYFVICANILGGCQGTTGPATENPQTGSPYGPDFPFITVRDIVNVHSGLLDHLGIDQVLAVVGGSLGGMQVLEWAISRPERVKSAVILASGSKLNAQGIAFNAVGRRAIFADPLFRDGWYYDQDEKPRFGLALARMVAHITYLSEQSIELKFGRKLQNGDEFGFDLRSETEFQIESYLHYQGKRFVERFDANSYLSITRAMDYFDLTEAYGSIGEAFSNVDCRFLVVSYTSDWLFPTAQSKEIVRALVDQRKHVTFRELVSPFGHDAFLIDQELPKLGSLVEPFLARTHHDLQRGIL